MVGRKVSRHRFLWIRGCTNIDRLADVIETQADELPAPHARHDDMSHPLLTLESISKRFGATLALTMAATTI
jgi:hypothetical protein